MQGVGFRPYVYRLAGELGVAGHVLNDSRGVVVEVEAPAETVDRFLARLVADAPPLAHVERVVPEALEETGETGFAIRESPAGGEPDAAVTPDSATCADCLAELFDPADRRFRYPFINCTNCGPRFTIVRERPVRPAEHDDGRLHDVRRVPARVRGSGRPPLPRAAERLPGLRPGGCACCPRPPSRWPPRSKRCWTGRSSPSRALGRLPPRLPRRRRAGGGAPARAQAPRGQAVRADGAGPRVRAAARRAERRRRERCCCPRERPIVLAPRRADAGGRGRGRAGLRGARRDAALLAAPPPAARRRRPRRS